MEGMLSPADVAVLSGNNRSGNDGLGFDNGAWWIIILLLFGWGRNGFGGNNGDGGFGAPNVYGKLDGISNGICDATFALNNNITNGFANVQSTLCQGFAGVNQGITTNGYETRGAITDLGYRLQDCCCQTQRSIDNVRFDLSQLGCGITNTINNSTRDILENNNNNTRAILDFLTQDKISTLQAENQTLKFQASQSAQNAFITANQEAQTAELIRRLGADCPIPAYVVPNPNCCYNYQVTSGCNCGNY
jgi:hypothetical protein